jgi:hypothetical protein
MKNGIYIDEQNQLEFVGVGQLSIGAGLQLDSRFSYDYSKKPQSITRRKKKTARTATVTLQIARNAMAQDLNIFEIIESFENIAGQTGDLYWNNANEGAFCVRGVSFSFAVDAVDIISAVQISLELTESYKKTETKSRKVARVELF